MNIQTFFIFKSRIMADDVFFFSHFCVPAPGHAVVTGVVSSCPPVILPSIFMAHRVQQSHCSSIFHRVLLTHALALSASQFGHKKKSPYYTNLYIRVCMHSGIRTYKYQTREDNLIRPPGQYVSCAKNQKEDRKNPTVRSPKVAAAAPQFDPLETYIDHVARQASG